jgi:hypothetical protein
MAIQTIHLDQQQQYQQKNTSKRTIKRLHTFNAPSVNKQTTKKSSNQQLKTTTNTLSLLVHTTTNVSNKALTNNTVTVEDIYQRPLPAKVKLIKLILESYISKNIKVTDKQFDYKKASAQISKTQQALSFNQQSVEQQIPNAQNIKFITIDGKQYRQQEQVSITTLLTEQQQLNFAMQGEFIIDNKKVNLNYQLNLKASYSSIHSIETTAAALKDPVVIQFGTRSIGYITDYTKFDINNDNKQNDLPIFSGDVGYLIFDKNNNHHVDNGGELFGPTTNNGFSELAQLDSNNNGFFDNQDDKYSQIYIWQPKQTKPNSNEQSPNKQNLVSLSQAGIKAISLNAITTQFNFRDQSKDNKGEINARLTQTSFAISENNKTLGVHQIDVRL